MLSLSEKVWLAEQVYSKEFLDEGCVFKNKGTVGRVCLWGTHAVVVFRGTELSDIQDLITNLKTWPVKNATCQGVVHAGTQEALAGVWGQIIQILTDNEVATCEFVGHSLGSMLATLAACWMFKEGTCAVSGVTGFGGPPVISRDAANRLASATTVTYVDHSFDIVPRLLTPRLLGLGRAGNLIYLSEYGGVWHNPSIWKRVMEWATIAAKEKGNLVPGVRRHGISLYRMRIDRR